MASSVMASDAESLKPSATPTAMRRWMRFVLWMDAICTVDGCGLYCGWMRFVLWMDAVFKQLGF